MSFWWTLFFNILLSAQTSSNLQPKETVPNDNEDSIEKSDKYSDKNNNDLPKAEVFNNFHLNPKEDLIDELKLVQNILELRKRAEDSSFSDNDNESLPNKMDMLPKSYQIIRQYPILSRHES